MTYIEIVYPKRVFKGEDEPCPKCNGIVVYGMIPCPDGRPGCCVCHYGYTCLGCGATFGKEEGLK